MADPVITSRPDKTVDGFNSTWISCGGKLPVQYNIQNDKFPTNSFDTIFSVTQINDNGGLAQIQTAIASPLSVGQYVKLTGFTNTSYLDKVAIIHSVDSVNTFTISISFNGNDTGNVQRFYNNYATEVRIYAGIDSAHPLTAEDPIELVSTIKQIPESDNITRLDVSQIVKTKLSDERNIISGNNINSWKDFYIEFREIYTGSSTSFIDDSSTFIGKAAYNTLQFGNSNGGNLIGLFVDDDPLAPTAKFLTNFERLVYFLGLSSKEISIISNIDTFDLFIEQYDSGNNVIQSDTISYSGNGYGLYNLSFSNINPDASYALVNIEDFSGVLSEVKRVDVDDSLCVLLFSAPSNLTATLNGVSSIKLSWVANSSDETGFEIERSLSSGSGFTQIATVAAGVTTYNDNGLSPDTYFYRVRAVKVGEQSAYSNEAFETIPESFSYIVNTSTTAGSANNQFELPLVLGGNYDFIIDWGDSTQDTITSASDPSRLHTYSMPGVYTIKIVGLIRGFSFGSAIGLNDALKVEEISNWGTLQLTGANAFIGCSNMVLTTNDELDLSFTTTLQSTFQGCANIGNSCDFSLWDVSSITSFASMFLGCNTFNGTGLNTWITNSLTNLGSCFSDCFVFDQPLNNWNVSSVSTFSSTFNNCLAFNRDLDSWSVNTATNFSSMFFNCDSFNGNIDNWVTSSALNMNSMFRQCDNFNRDIGGWSVGTVTNMGSMFNGALIFNRDLNSWNVNSVDTLSFMFNNAQQFNSNITGWVLSSAQFMGGMFQGATVFNQDISGWNTSLVSDMSFMFRNATAFDRNLASWNISQLNTADQMFFSASSFSTANLDNLLNGWASQVPSIQNNVVFGAEATARSSASDAAVTTLTGSPYNWTINTL